MRSIFFLSIKELEKIIRKKMIVIPFLLLMVILISSGVISYTAKQNDQDWKSDITQQIKDDEILLEEAKKMNEEDKYTNIIYQKVITNKYYLENNINPTTDTVLAFINNHVGLTTLISIFIIVYASGIMSNEFSWGTITFLAVKPYSRTKIFLGKYISLLLLTFGFYILLLLVLSIEGIIIYGIKSLDSFNMILVDGELVQQNIVFSIVSKYGLSLIPTITYTTMAYMISIIARSSVVATAVSLGLLIFGGTLSAFVEGEYWAKFLLFVNTDLSKYVTGGELLVSDLSFSIIINLVYTAFFLFLALYYFNKRDLA